MDRLSHFLLGHRATVLVGWLVLCVGGGIFAIGLPDRIVSGGEASDSSDSEAVARTLEHSPLASLFVVVTVPPDAAPAALTQATQSAADALVRVDGVTGTAPFPATALPDDALGDTAPVDTSGGNVAVLGVVTSGGTDGAIHVAHTVEQNRANLVPEGAAAYVGGFGAYRDELTELSKSDLERAERVGIPIVFLVLLISFGSMWAAGLPLVIALSSLVMGLGAAGVAALWLPMSDFVTNASSMIGIALGVDYAMFLVQRVRELVHSRYSVDAAVTIALRTTGIAVLWSGLTVVAAESTLLLVDSRSVRSAAFGMVMVTIAAVATALIVAPVLISLLGKRLTRSGRHSVKAQRESRWAAWARHVLRYAPLWLSGVAVLVVCLAIPTLGLRDSVSVSGTSTLPASSPVRQAYELAAQRYGPSAVSPVMVVLPPGLAPPGSTPAQQAATERASFAAGVISSDSRVVAVDSHVLADGSAVLAVTPRDGPYDASTRALVESLRHGDLDAQMGGIEHLVGGETAAAIDATAAMFDGLPKVGVVLLVVIAVVLLLALRSILLPVKAIVMVALSLGASLGGLLLLTGTELGAKIIGADGPGDIHPIVPVTIVAITVALSTDYEVMLVSRIGEDYRRTGDNAASVVSGVGRTGGVITSAAVIMIAVFAGFALADLQPLKQLGVGLALAVLLDATVVRGVLVPAAMAVMGRANWWWPGGKSAAPVSRKAACRHRAQVVPPPPASGPRHRLEPVAESVS